MMPTTLLSFRKLFARPLTMLASLTLLCGFSEVTLAQSSGRVLLSEGVNVAQAAGVDLGEMPVSQRLQMTLTLKPSADRIARLDGFLREVRTPGTADYRHWVTPAEFGERFGATAEQIEAASTWLVSCGLRVDVVDSSRMRITTSGFRTAVESAFGTSMRMSEVNGVRGFRANAAISVPEAMAGLVVGVSGLDTFTVADVKVTGATGLLPGVEQAVEANLTRTILLSGQGALGAAAVRGYAGFFRQGAAEGITILTQGLPGFADATSLRAGSDAIFQEVRPEWQAAAGLPADVFRASPDFVSGDATALIATFERLADVSGSRLGNIAPQLYALAPLEGLFTHADDSSAGAWETGSGLGTVDLAMLAKVFPRGASASNTSVTSSVGSPVHGQSFSLTSMVTSSGGGAVPTGTVTYTSSQASFPTSSGTVNGGGVTTSAPYQLPGGSYTITATYSGDATYASSASSVGVTVQAEAANFTLTAPASATLGSSISVTVKLSSTSQVGTPSASVVVTPSGYPGATPVTQTVTGTGGTASATYTFPAAQAGTISFQAICTSNDSSFTCYTPQTTTSTVPQGSSTTSLTITPNPPTAGAPVTFSATVTGVAGVAPTGTVQFLDGATVLGNGGAPNATFSGTLLPGTTHTITANYQGDTNYLRSVSNAVNATVGLASTVTSVNASATSASFGQTVTLSVTVTPSTTVNGTLPTGTLSLSGAGITTSAPVQGGSATVSLQNLAVGTYTIGTSYSGDKYYAGGTGNTVVISVTQAAATLASSLSTISFTTNSTAVLTTTVTMPGSAQLPASSGFTATITGVTGASYPGVFTVNVGGNTGTGSVTIPAPPAGTYTLTVSCAGNTNFTCTPSSLAISSTATATTPGATATTTVLTLNPATPAAGQTVILTATVSTLASATATTPIAGIVTFYDGTLIIASAPVTAVGTTGVATAPVVLTGGAHSLTAAYGGNTSYAASTSAAVPVSTVAGPAAISLTASVTNTLVGLNVVFTATVSGTTAGGQRPTGTVQFFVSGPTARLLGTAPLAVAGAGVGIATFSTTGLPAGSNTIYAVYSGDTNFMTATSTSITLGLSDYTLAFLPQSITLSRGQTGQATVILGIVNGFGGDVAFGCTPPPNALITCSFSPTVLTGGGSTTLTLTTVAAKSQTGNSASLRVVGGLALAGLLGLLLPGRKGRRRLPTLLLVLVALAMTANLGCFESNFNDSGQILSGGSPLGTTNLTINSAGSDGVNTVRHNFTYQVTVQ